MRGYSGKISVLFLLLLLLPTAVLSAQTGSEAVSGEDTLSAEDPDSLLRQIASTGDAEFYDKALSLIEEGSAVYPEDYRFPMARGDLFESQELYDLALNSYREAEVLAPEDVELRRKTASALSYLDRNFEAVDYLESLLDEDDVLDDLGWMYFKTHQPEKGVVLLEEALEKEFDRNLSLTLGTLYSELNSPELCRKYYLDAINDALKDSDSYFASVGYYNLSLAEKSFYDYEAAYTYARESLELMDRAAGHLALGDLYMMKMAFGEAEREFRQAVDFDKTPLSRSNLASLYLVQGRLDETLEQLKKIEEAVGDESWMYYYGLNQDQFIMDLYRQYYEVYKGKVNEILLMKTPGWRNGLRRTADLIVFKGKSLYYRTLYRVLALREGRSQLEGGSLLRGSLTLASGTEDFRAYSVRYYLRARDLEVFDQAEPWYDQMIGRERKDREMLLRAESAFDPEWEALAVSEGVREQVLLTRPGSRERDELVSRVYRANPGALLQYGLPLPLRLELTGSEMDSREKRGISRALRRSGVVLRSYDGVSLTLRVNLSETLQYTLSSREGEVLVSGSYPMDEAGDIQGWAREFRAAAFGR
ncbi:MAG: hypothetical protein PQJ50_18230 [Spirochaetales bacterium]|nr:hypothetical protein [Spirochaetales bacterium]